MSKISPVHPLHNRFAKRGPVLQIVLDGWGEAESGPGNAIAQAHTPTLDSLRKRFPFTTMLTHGHHVGLPDTKDIGGSEVGHSTMGAGRVLKQGASRIQDMLDDGTLFKNDVAEQVWQRCVGTEKGALHLIGLLSDGNVHSHINHFIALIREAARRGVQRCYVHVLLDGRDVPWQSAEHYLSQMETELTAQQQAHSGWEYCIASGGGREAITMDRDKNWQKIQRGWHAHVLGQAPDQFTEASQAIQQFRQNHPDRSDQEIPPFVITKNGVPIAPIKDGDALVNLNFRGDRMLQFSHAVLDSNFPHFERKKLSVLYAGMAVYDEDSGIPPLALLQPAPVERPLGERLVEKGLRQFRLAETQKYAHVTWFFNGGRREPLDAKLESYCLIDSQQLDSFEHAPAMRATEIADAACQLLTQDFRFGLINFANADMVGHTGNLSATIEAAEAVDCALAKIIARLQQVDGLAIICADHGNAEEMLVHNSAKNIMEPSTKHSLNPVPVYFFDSGNDLTHCALDTTSKSNTLANLGATAMTLMGLPVPEHWAPSLLQVLPNANR